MVTERGGGFTWAENSYFFRLTPWHNDPVSDPASEVVYLQDAGDRRALVRHARRRSGRTLPYTIRHGAGASTFSHEHDGIATQLTLGMAEDAPVKLALLRVTNRDERARRLTVTTYVEWTLGVLREHTQHQVRTAFDREQATIFARNSFDPQFAGWTAFHAITEPVTRVHRRAAAISWDGTAPPRRRRRWVRPPARAASPAPASIPAPRSSACSSWRRARPARSPSCSAPRESEAAGTELLGAIPRRRAAQRRIGDRASRAGRERLSRDSRARRRSPPSTR